MEIRVKLLVEMAGHSEEADIVLGGLGELDRYMSELSRKARALQWAGRRFGALGQKLLPDPPCKHGGYPVENCMECKSDSFQSDALFKKQQERIKNL